MGVETPRLRVGGGMGWDMFGGGGRCVGAFLCLQRATSSPATPPCISCLAPCILILSYVLSGEIYAEQVFGGEV